MTCTGCETKLNRTLATMASIGNLKTSLVLSRVELDVDLSLTTVESVMTPGENDRVHVRTTLEPRGSSHRPYLGR